MTADRDGYIQYADVLRICAAVAVVALHTAAPLLYQYKSLPPSWWLAGNIVDSAVRPAVPLFLMLSGALLLDGSKHGESVASFFKKRFKRVFLPFLTWGVIYLLWQAYYTKEPLSFIIVLRKIVAGQIYSHMLFLYEIMGLYIITPVLRVYTRYADERNMRYLIIIWFLIVSVNPLINNFFEFYVGGFKIDIFTGYIGYFITGHYLNIRRPGARGKELAASLALFMFGTIITAVGTYYLTVNNNGVLNQYFYGCLSPNVIIMSYAVFLFFKNIHFEGFIEAFPRGWTFVRFLSSASFGIFLVHLIVLKELSSRGGINAMLVHPLVGIPVTIFLTVTISAGVIALLKKLPYVNRIAV